MSVVARRVSISDSTSVVGVGVWEDILVVVVGRRIRGAACMRNALGVLGAWEGVCVATTAGRGKLRCMGTVRTSIAVCNYEYTPGFNHPPVGN